MRDIAEDTLALPWELLPTAAEFGSVMLLSPVVVNVVLNEVKTQQELLYNRNLLIYNYGKTMLLSMR